MIFLGGAAEGTGVLGGAPKRPENPSSLVEYAPSSLYPSLYLQIPPLKRYTTQPFDIVCKISLTHNFSFDIFDPPKSEFLSRKRKELWMKKRCLSWVLFVAVLGMIPLTQALANDVVEYEVTNYWQQQSFGHVYRIDFTTCTVSEPAGVGTPQAIVKQSFTICRKDSRVRFSITHANGYVIDYDWILEDGGRIVKGAYKDSNVGWGPSIGRARQILSPPAVSLAGRWVAYREGRKVADCSIQQQGTTLTLIIHRTPEERSRGRLVSATQLEATDWREQGTVSPDARRINWRNSYWTKVD